ncbi:MAG: YceI family protein [Nevskia sp.]|nr:YceI family protein [Nevskia sp.]
MSALRHALIAAALAVGAVQAGPIDAAKSRITAQFTQMNVPVEDPFTRFSGTVDFDPAHPERARAHLDIDLSSFDLGDPDYSAEICKPEWFDCAHHPRASFEASALEPLGGGRYALSGTLSLKGKTQDLRIPVTLVNLSGANAFDGAVTISRSHFEIGGPDWKDVVADAVKVSFHIVIPTH